ncbi:MAG: hypothetical protein FJ147_21120 [Deltaproteobacteria bacterium]|nr:hypothetical protein [Deltaproteobacteria bacterium]
MRQSLGSQVAMLITVSAVFFSLPARSWSQTTEPPALVRITPSLVHIEPGKVPHVVAMTVKIVDPADHFVVDTHTKGEPVQWLPHTAKVDGYYRYEVWVTWQEPTGGTASSSTEKGEQAGRRSDRVWGGFTVQSGVITLPAEEPSAGVELPTGATVRHNLTQLGQAFFDWLTPSAHAADLTASGTVPSVLFDAELVGSANSIEWRASLYTTGGGAVASWELVDRQGGIRSVIDLRGSANNLNSIVVDANGDMSLASGKVFIDRSDGNVGIGTTTPVDDFHIVSSAPSIRLTDTNALPGGVSWQLSAATNFIPS